MTHFAIFSFTDSSQKKSRFGSNHSWNNSAFTMTETDTESDIKWLTYDCVVVFILPRDRLCYRCHWVLYPCYHSWFDLGLGLRLRQCERAVNRRKRRIISIFLCHLISKSLSSSFLWHHLLLRYMYECYLCE